jgi:hypothetical protein
MPGTDISFEELLIALATRLKQDGVSEDTILGVLADAQKGLPWGWNWRRKLPVWLPVWLRGWMTYDEVFHSSKLR